MVDDSDTSDESLALASSLPQGVSQVEKFMNADADDSAPGFIPEQMQAAQQGWDSYLLHLSASSSGNHFVHLCVVKWHFRTL
ncbi:MAG: hypothetical protein AB7Q01_13730 [Gammaproteobacteria bacterium]